MNALTICNPYPELSLLGEKPIENRTWPAPRRYLGDRLFIHAGASKAWMCDDYARRFPRLTYGAIVGVATLAACLELRAHTWPTEFAHLKDHEHADGPWCWVLTDVQRFRQPVPCKGSQGVWLLENLKEERDRVIAAVLGQMQEATQ